MKKMPLEHAEDAVPPIQHWANLRAATQVDGRAEIASIPSDVQTGFGRVRYAIGPYGEPRILIPCGPGTTLSQRRASDNLVVRIASLTDQDKVGLYIDVYSRLHSLDVVFSELASEIINRLREGQSPVKSVEGTISDFRALLDSATDDAVNTVIVGLLGELLVLRSLCQISCHAIDAWTGPYDQRHDFRRNNHALEVKTSTRADAFLITISSIDQLSSPPSGDLMLAHVRIERAASGSITVASLVRDLLKLGVPQERLIDRLSAVGCTSHAAPEWNRIQFELEGLTVFRVDDGFPRISAKQFPGGVTPSGIHGITYTVDLSLAQAFVLKEGEVTSALARIAL
jgi:hypothetical protein